MFASYCLEMNLFVGGSVHRIALSDVATRCSSPVYPFLPLVSTFLFLFIFGSN